MSDRFATGPRATLLGVLGLLVACSGDNGPTGVGNPPPPPPQGMFLSNPVSLARTRAPQGATPLATVGSDNLVYVSLSPGTAPSGVIARVGNLVSGVSVTTPVFDGGFDPVPLSARVGDSVEVVVTDATGTPVLHTRAPVPLRRPPRVVRSDPSHGKTDVPLNASIVVVFSEPVNPATLTATSLSLHSDSLVVPGSVAVTDSSNLAAVFTPSSLLAPVTRYRLEVTQDVRDLDGDALEAPVAIEFTTGLSATSPVGSVTVEPAAATILVGGFIDLGVPVQDSASGTVVWASSNPAVAQVSATTGVVTGVAPGSATITATIGERSGTAAIDVRAELPLTAVAAGGAFTCGLSPGGAAFCWGINVALGTGTTTYRTPMPVSVAGRHTFAQLSAGTVHACGLTPGGAAYCWGSNPAGQLGNGTTEDSSVPVAVLGGLTFTSISAGDNVTCGVASNSVAYCWGSNFGSVPVAVPGGLEFSAVTAGSGHSCGLTLTFRAYCWGSNSWGELGDGTTINRPTPVAVAGGLAFAALAAGTEQTCGLTPSGAAYCWGTNGNGSLGAPARDTCNLYFACSKVPVAVLGGLTFSTLSTRFGHVCGVTPSGAAYCWGSNRSGQLGTGTTGSSLVPASVSGGLSFTSISAGSSHTCGRATDGAVYCWGDNSNGQLGDGSLSDSWVPLTVAGQQ